MAGLLRLVAPALVLVLLTWAPAASALVDHSGNEIAATSTAGTAAQLSGGPTVTQMLFSPATPGDDDPAALAALGSSATPEDDLGAALDALRDASSASAAQDARRRAMDILVGNPISGKAYSGMPLLNWDVPSKIKDVPPGGDVRVREVRFGDTALIDTSLLRFADPDQPFTITYEIADLGPGADGELAPTPLLADAAGPIGGLHSILQPLTFAPVLTGTLDSTPFTTAMGNAQGGKEQTRQGVQQITVRMPPPRYVDAVLDPDLVAHGDPMSAGGNPITALHPATAGRVAEVENTFGFSGNAPSDAQREAAIAKIGANAPERMLYDDLRGLNAGDLVAANALGLHDRALVSAMRSHADLPPGFAGDPAADVSMVLLNGEPYRTRDVTRVPAGGSVTVSVTNGDAYTRTITATQLFNHHATLGAVDWGQFDWALVDLGAAATLAPGESHTFTITPRDDAFELVIADPDHGEQGTWALALDRGPLKQSLDMGAGTGPTHVAQDSSGDIWVTLAGIDAIGRLKPGANLAGAAVERFLVPGGNHNFDPLLPPLAPHALQFDAHGILWVTLDAGNAIARVDPAQVRDGTEDGIRVYKLNQCNEAICPLPFPPEPGATPPLTRLPVQMDVEQDGAGNTVVFFAEENASAIGALRVAPDGTELDKVDYPCQCRIPTGMRLDPDGSVWFSEIVENRIGHLTLDQSQPFKVSAASLQHFNIPSGVTQVDPALIPGGVPFTSSAPHSLTVDRHGDVWFSEQATSKIGMLDPEKANPGTTDGMTELPLQRNDFGRDPVPADITVDRRDNVYWTDEYGDAVGSVTPAGINHQWRPSERNSLTDSPVADSDGNLWFIEVGADLLTRISGITGGPFSREVPPSFVARTAAGTLSADGLSDFSSVDVTVSRGGQVIKQVANVGADGGSFSLDAGLRAGDRVQITPHGDFAPAPFSFTVATLTADAPASGKMTGTATSGGSALADQVVVSSDGRGSQDADIDPSSGAFTAAGVASSGELSWAQGTPMGIFRTVSRFGPGGTDGNGPRGPSTTKPPVKPKAADACRNRLWLVRRGKSRSIPLLGATQKKVLACLGRPKSAARRGAVLRWRYGAGIELRFKGGKVFGITLRDKRFRSDPDGLRVGSKLATLRRALGARAMTARRALVRRRDGRYADVRFLVRSGKVRRITISLRRFTALDAAGRRLARSTR